MSLPKDITKIANYKKTLSRVHTGILLSSYHRKQIGKGGRGIKKPFSDIHKKALSVAQMGVQAGEKHHNWKGGITPENNKIRTSIETRLWREAVFARDGYTCQKTGLKGGKLTAHHILNFSSHPELRFAIDNGITLWIESHKEFHKKYGIKNNTMKQLLEYLTTKI